MEDADRAAFVQRFGGVFERSAWVAEAVWDGRPFGDLDGLHAAMVAAVEAAAPERQLALLRSHPELAGTEARAGSMTAESVGEQASAGLGALSAAEAARMAALNAAYRARFGFPFIIAVRRHDRAGIFGEFERRLAQDAAGERRTALENVYLIARLRLEALGL